MSARILVSVSPHGVGRVTLNRPGKVNALGREMMLDLAAALRSLDGDRSVRLIVIEGRGEKGFCAGADIVEFAGGDEALQGQEQALIELILVLSSVAAPRLAVVHGRTLGAGGIIAALCDVVLAADNLSFGFPEVRFGMYPVIVHAVLLEKLPEVIAWQLCATGRLLPATEAQALGLVSEVLSGTPPSSAVDERIAFYAERAEVLELGKRLMRSAAAPLPERLKFFSPLMLENFRRPGVRERICAYLDRIGDR